MSFHDYCWIVTTISPKILLVYKKKITFTFMLWINILLLSSPMHKSNIDKQEIETDIINYVSDLILKIKFEHC